MGGTFDPIHNGHLVAASEVADLFDLDEVIFVPSGQPWQKDRQVSAGEDRYLMTVIATAANPRFSVSRVDIDRDGPTYTKDTLRDLHALNPECDLYFITGADALASILSWQDWEELFAMARFVGVSRPGYELHREHIAGLLDGMPDDALTLVEIPALAISSTDCRRRAAEGRPLWYLMPDGVLQYVSKRRLYSTPHGEGVGGIMHRPDSAGRQRGPESRGSPSACGGEPHQSSSSFSTGDKT
jgi:nicotinate-nucleotide adenylyltransferase